ncbi:MAG: DNA alkylation repair protein [Ghiorsea sp.]|nr:DNA alkylation repair protein [Ghiorsea sp.]
MPEPLKNLYNDTFFDSLNKVMVQAYPSFDVDKFRTLIFDESWEAKELKQRMRHITESLHQCLPDYEQAIPILKAASSQFSNTFTHMFFPEYAELYGMKHYDISMDALEHFTQYSSSEFAIRPFIIQYPEKTMQHMQAWAKHENEHVRRLASEGCRPRLPWAMQLPAFVQDPNAILEILEQLKHDESLYVRRSVANNLNDIAKDHPQIVCDVAKSWLGHNQDTDWLVKHACRTLLKQAHPETLALFGFTPAEHVQVQNFTVSPQVSWGAKVEFSATLNSDKPLGKLRLEFAIDFMKANGKTARKVFKISESKIKETSKIIKKSFSFKAISTRKYYAGKHQLSLIINGLPICTKPFTLSKG